MTNRNAYGCPRCSGQLVKWSTGSERSCLACGYEQFVPKLTQEEAVAEMSGPRRRAPVHKGIML